MEDFPFYTDALVVVYMVSVTLETTRGKITAAFGEAESAKKATIPTLPTSKSRARS